MTEFKKFDTAYIKTTGETVTIYSDGVNEEGLLRVKRPVMTKDGGIVHKMESIFPQELETQTERDAREQAAELAQEKRKLHVFNTMQELVDSRNKKQTVPAMPMDS